MKVVAICGSGRSGSTLLDTLLGSFPGCFAAGELRELWSRGILEGRRCGCGRSVWDCQVWGAVLGAPEFSDVDAETIVALQHATARFRHLRRLLRAERFRTQRELVRLVSVIGDLYRVLGRVTGADVIIDSSKRPADVAILRLLPDVDTYIVHLVRDPRAVAYSLSRRKPALDRDAQPEMDRMGAIKCTGYWIMLNVAAEVVCRRVGPGRSLRIRYEDLVAQPRATLAAITTLAGTPQTPSPLINDHTVRLEPNHMVFGNPDRFRTGPTPLRLDDAWRTRIKGAPWAAATLLAMPMMARYGYYLLDGNPLPQQRRSGRAE